MRVKESKSQKDEYNKQTIQQTLIQRIQSFWLVLAACCMALCFLTPMAEYHLQTIGTGQTIEAALNLVAKDNPEMMQQMMTVEPVVTFDQKMSGFATWPLVALAIATAALALVSIFLYKNRVVQMRVVAVGFLLNVVYVFLAFFWAVDAFGKSIIRLMGDGEMEVAWQAGAYAPIAGLVFFILAHSAIKKDEAKVRAADRLR